MRPAAWWSGWFCAWALVGCGGGGSSTPAPSSSDVAPPASCDAPTVKRWVNDYLGSWYYWNHDLAAAPDVNGTDTVASYFGQRLYDGRNSAAPYKDRWSYLGTTADFDQYFTEGRTLGYGLSVAGRMDDPLPVRVRYVAPGSAAEAAGLRRGMVIDALNGQPASSFRNADNAGFTPLAPAQAGDTVNLRVLDAPGAASSRDLTLTASVYALTPVGATTVVTSAGGRKLGYMLFTTFISQARTPLNDAFAQLKSQGVTEMVLDLRYNGGGLVSTSRDLASAIVGPAYVGQRYTRLKFNAEHAAQDNDYLFNQSLTALGVKRVYVLSGPRTCSASELVINGLKGLDGLEVVQVGSTTCGKPFGFQPRDNGCGQTFSVVNFASVNAKDAGAYVDGLAPSCVVADDFDHALGNADEGLLAEARAYADRGSCSAAAATGKALGAKASRAGPAGAWTRDGDERQGLTDR